MIKKINLLLLCIGFFPTFVFGGSYALISDLGTSAETIGIGNIEGFSDAAHTVFENPAGLHRIDHYSLSLFTTTLMNEVHYNAVAIGGKTPFGNVGLGYMEATVLNIDFTQADSNNEYYTQYYFDYKDTIYKFSYQLSVNPQLHIGATYSLYGKNFWKVSASGSNFDFGLLWQHSRDVTFSFITRNFLPQSKIFFSNDGSETLPTQIIPGIKWSLNDVSLLSQVKLSEGKSLFSFGASYNPYFLPLILFSTGYKQHLSYVNDVKNTATMGVGLSLYGLKLHYAYERSDYLLLDHHSYFSISNNF
jgi:hypothetical protein